jgi:hypothetical protein
LDQPRSTSLQRRPLAARGAGPAARGPLPQLEAGQLMLLLVVVGGPAAARARHEGLRRRVGRAGGRPVNTEIPGRRRAPAPTAASAVPFHCYAEYALRRRPSCPASATV